jgi:hypothetical protein
MILATVKGLLNGDNITNFFLSRHFFSAVHFALAFASGSRAKKNF